MRRQWTQYRVLPWRQGDGDRRLAARLWFALALRGIELQWDQPLLEFYRYHGEYYGGGP